MLIVITAGLVSPKLKVIGVFCGALTSPPWRLMGLTLAMTVPLRMPRSSVPKAPNEGIVIAGMDTGVMLTVIGMWTGTSTVRKPVVRCATMV
ncbi:hypothetical protein MYIN104542_29565 [Mycobacterium intermedium]